MLGEEVTGCKREDYLDGEKLERLSATEHLRSLGLVRVPWACLAILVPGLEHPRESEAQGHCI